MIIGVDVDGVLRDFVGSLTKVYERVYPDHMVQPITAWELHEFFPIKGGVYDLIWRSEYTWEILTQARSYEGMISMLGSLVGLGDDVALVTTQPTTLAKDATWHWVEDNRCLLYTDDIFFCGKIKRWQLPLDVLIDDCVKNLREARAAGIRAVCVDRPWNTEWNGERMRKPSDLCLV